MSRTTGCKLDASCRVRPFFLFSFNRCTASCTTDFFQAILCFCTVFLKPIQNLYRDVKGHLVTGTKSHAFIQSRAVPRYTAPALLYACRNSYCHSTPLPGTPRVPGTDTASTPLSHFNLKKMFGPVSATGGRCQSRRFSLQETEQKGHAPKKLRSCDHVICEISSAH